ncbi:type I polyketide synthase [Nocardia sp. CA-129566]|uniref:type I polyketide synthase n=1 Tax=Nocardia sp. CA-129566 TaxID=3239976 RepID=UPI003D982B5A
MNTSTQDLVEALRKSVRENKLLRKMNEEALFAQREPIAIVGLGCRFPGGVASAEELWELVAGGREATGEFPLDRGWDPDLYDPDPDVAGKSYTRSGGFVYDAGDFDAAFFGISPREAVAMDPHQRLLLETSWTALEDAGIDPMSLRGSSTGVFAGLIDQGYGAGPERSVDVEGLRLTGSTASVVSGRVAYVLGLQGPAVTIDTACSSALVTMHLACQSLRCGESDLALASGVTVVSSSEVFVELSRQRAISPDGRSKSFAASADGTGWSEGVGVLVLERLSDARRNGHRVLAVVRGSAVNQDGASNGLTAPNGPAQQRVIGAALGNAGLSAADVDVVEAHGTGTTLGDPIEAQAIIATYGQGRPVDRPLWLGSVKSNLGHTQAAAGAAGVIKMIMAMRHGVLPRTLHVDAPTPHVDWSAGAVRLVTEARPWDTSPERPRRAGVSSFGISGTNAHIILEQVPEFDPQYPGDAEPSGVVEISARTPWVVSGRTPAALAAQAERLQQFVSANADAEISDIAVALLRRSRFEHRAVVLGAGRDDMLSGLSALARGIPAVDVVTGRVRTSGGTVFVFPGQGSQWVGMGRELLDSSPVFARRMGECAAVIQPLVDWPFTAAVRGSEQAPSLERIEVLQPVLFAMMVSLAEVWRSVGIEPDAVVGSSQGEIAAACVAGCLPLAEAARIVVARSRLFAEEMVGRGHIVSVAAPESVVAERLAGVPDVWLAGVNGPASVTVAGATEAVEGLAKTLQDSGIRVRTVASSVASHSPMVEPVRTNVLDLLSFVHPVPGSVAFYSTVSAQSTDGRELDAEYWYGNCRYPVLFERTVHQLLHDGFDRFIEVSPHPVLVMAIDEIAADRGVAVSATASLRRDEGGWTRLSTSMAEAFTAGVDVDWSALLGGRGRWVELPAYAFERQRYWLESVRGGGDPAALGLAGAGHPLLGAVLDSAADGGVVLTGSLSLATQPWLAEHGVRNTVIFPGAGLVELVAVAGDRVGCPVVGELLLQAPLVLPEVGGVRVQVVVEGPQDSGERAVRVFSRPEDGVVQGDSWTLHAQGSLRRERIVTVEPEAHQWPPRGAVPVDVAGLYQRLAERGYDYGPAFQGLSAAWRAGDAVYAEVILPESVAGRSDSFVVHPALLDAALHAAFLVEPAASSELLLPFAWTGVTVHSHGARRVWVRATTNTDAAERRISLLVADGAGNLVVTVDDLALRPVSQEQLSAAAHGPTQALHRVDWVALDAAGTAAAGGPRHRVDLDGAEVLLDEVEAPGSDGPVRVPTTLVVQCRGSEDTEVDVVSAVHATVGRVLSLVQRWLAAAGTVSARLVLVTRGAVACGAAESVSDPVAAAVWGLVRSAQSENPGRIMLVDVEDWDTESPLTDELLGAEPQLAIRGDRLRVPRLARALVSTAGPRALLSGTVLVTGGTGGLGAVLVRHLVAEYGVRRLVLVSRRGPAAPGAAELVADLAESGAVAEVVACDVSDRAQLAAVLAAIPAAHPLALVVHAAGVLDDGVISSLTASRLAAVLAAKADAAWYLHELTVDLDLAGFVLFSSVAGTLGTAGQAGYASANAFLDGLASYRRGRGSVATSIAWGLWQRTTEMGAHLTDTDLTRLQRAGVLPISDEQGAELFDLAIAQANNPLAIAVRLNRHALRDPMTTGDSPLLRDLVPVRRHAANEPRERSFATRLVDLDHEQQHEAILELVRRQAAAVLGFSTEDGVESDHSFKSLGFDSLRVLEFRNRLEPTIGVSLPVAAVFDHPTPRAFAAFLHRTVLGIDSTAAGSSYDEESELRRILLDIPISRLRETGLLGRLLELASGAEPDGELGGGDIDAMDVDALLSLARDLTESEGF